MIVTTRKRHSPERAGAADRMLGEGKDVADVCRELQVSEQTYYRWRNQFGGLKGDGAKRPRSSSGRTRPSSGFSLTRSWRRRR